MAVVKADDREWRFDEGELLNTEMIAIERQTGLTNDEFWDATKRGSFIALTALVWILRRREPDEAGLAFDDVVFRAATFDIDQTDDMGKDSPDGTARSSKTSSSTTAPPSPDGSGSDPGSSVS